ncbi:MAG: hypothetical protein ACI3T9_04465 [Romboutsia timonensis]
MINKLMEGKVLNEVGTPYLYIKIDNEIWLLHEADKRIFKATYYPIDKFKLPNKEYTVLERNSIVID